jgi:hypothetical protein
LLRFFEQSPYPMLPVPNIAPSRQPLILDRESSMSKSLLVPG